jgi:hypothetical protein
MLEREKEILWGAELGQCVRLNLLPSHNPIGLHGQLQGLVLVYIRQWRVDEKGT